MANLDLEKIEKIHFIGIGGIGMSALARLLLADRKSVSGSDREASEITKALAQEGATIFNTQVKENTISQIELIIYTEAMPQDHEEMIAARKLGVPMMNYFEALGLALNQYYLIAVSGTHGKTTTTAMLTDILEEAGLDPTAIIGSLRIKTRSNFRAGKSKYAIVEACEYRRDFLHLKPDVLVITNIDAEHLDYYKDLVDIQNAFAEFTTHVREGGTIVANLKDPNIKTVLQGIEREVVDYCTFFDPTLSLTQPGLHNQMNAAAARAVSDSVGIEEDVAKESLENFSGTWRRFEYKGEVNGAKVYDDYGHHPTEITATLKGVRELYPNKNIILAFEPHLGSRTLKLFDDFVASLSKADRIILAPIYAARTENKSDTSSKKLANALQEVNPNTRYLETFDEIVEEIKKSATEKDLILVMGAGDINKISEKLIV